jgi:hypothetical protein
VSVMVANAISLRSIDSLPSLIGVVAGAPIGDLRLLVCPTAEAHAQIFCQGIRSLRNV